jgi:pimeloyl-ACP methyl ester carboxylesterase
MSTQKTHIHQGSLAFPHLFFRQLGNDRKGIILFLHGITGSRRYWEKRVLPLAEDYLLILPDLLGFGLSPKPYLEYDVNVFRDSLYNFLQYNGFGSRRLHLVGHSLGGIIALEYAIRYPESVDRLVVMSLPRHENFHSAHEYFWKGSPSYRKLLNEHSVLENLAQLRRTGLDLTLKYLFRLPWGVIADARKFTLKSLTSTLEHCLLHYRIDPTLEKLDSRPVLWIHGHLDQVAPFEQVRNLPVRFPFIQMESFPTSGHHVFLTHTRDCLTMIQDFLNGDGTSV